MDLNPPSFRLPFNLPEDMDPEVRRAIEFTMNGVTNHEQAFRNLKLGTTVQNTTIVQSGGGGGGGGTGAVTVGGVNDQRGVTAYTTQQSDYGTKIILADASPIMVTLNAGVTTPWFTLIDNDSSAVAVLAPSSGSLIGEQNIPGNGFGLVFFDGANWFCGAVRLASPTIPGYVRPDNVTITVDSTTGVLSTTGVFIGRYVAETANYAVQPSDYQIECTANTFTVTLPTAVGVTGQEYSIKNSGTGTITVATNSAQTIDGNLTQTLMQWDNLQVMSNGANWMVI
jgi:hypothetical protein